MESWHISLIIGVITYISIFVTLKNKTEQHGGDIEKIQRYTMSHEKEDDDIHGKIFSKMDIIHTDVAEHKVKLANAPTMEQVRSEFVSKEMFKQMEKHIDEKFDKLENGIEKILDRLEKRI